jgi:serine/threonine protein kinase
MGVPSLALIVMSLGLGLGYIGPFRLLEIVNRGQSCCLWRAYDDENREFIGVKTLLESAAKQRGQVHLLENEYKVASKFSHPNLIRIFHYDWYNKVPYIGMEWFSALNLKMWINRGYETYCPHLQQIFVQMTKALAYQHDQGWVHRDVKPDNFLFHFDSDAVEDKDKVKVKMIDFALAKKTSPDFMKWFTLKGKVQGTASYMAPEQIQRLPAAPGADLYSLGCTFYELLTTRLIFTGDTLNDLLNKHLSAPPPPVLQRNRNVTPEFAELLKMMLAKRPQDRPKSTTELLRLLLSTRPFRRPPSKSDVV